jgi:hypothetical protein
MYYSRNQYLMYIYIYIRTHTHALPGLGSFIFTHQRIDASIFSALGFRLGKFPVQRFQLGGLCLPLHPRGTQLASCSLQQLRQPGEAGKFSRLQRPKATNSKQQQQHQHNNSNTTTATQQHNTKNHQTQTQTRT